MSTFLELQTRLAALKSRSAILEYLIERVDVEFRVHAGTAPKRVLMTSEKTAVPEAEFERLVVELTEELREIRVEVDRILAAPLEQPTAPAPAPQGPVPFHPQTIPMAAPLPLSKKSKKGTNQEEVQS